MMPDNVLYVVGNSASDLQNKVNEAYFDGYRLYGQPIVNNQIFLQTMVFIPSKANKKIKG